MKTTAPTLESISVNRKEAVTVLAGVTNLRPKPYQTMSKKVISINYPYIPKTVKLGNLTEILCKRIKSLKSYLESQMITL